MEPVGQTTQLNLWLARHREGDPRAKEELIAHSCERLRILASRMLRKNFSRVGRWEETGDVLQSALTRLHRSLAEVQPESVERFVGLAATQIRRTLFDLARHHFGPEGMANKHHSDGKNDVPLDVESGKSSNGPETPEDWAALHEAVEKLPEDERRVTEHLFYEGMTQIETAELLCVTERTIRRRWMSAKLLLNQALDGELPE